MRIGRERVLGFLKECHELRGGYTGNDISILAKELGVHDRTIRRSIERWSQTDHSFAQLRYLGQRTLPLTLEEIHLLKATKDVAPLAIADSLFQELNSQRELLKHPPLSRATFYRYFGKVQDGPPADFKWFAAQGISLNPGYSIEAVRATLDTLYTYSGLKGWSGIDMVELTVRLAAAEADYQATYPGTDPLVYYPNIRPRIAALPRHLTSIRAGRLPEVQARLIFELQTAFVVEARDFLMAQCIARRGRVQQSMNASYQREENTLRTGTIDRLSGTIRGTVSPIQDVERQDILDILDTAKDIPVQARVNLLRIHASTLTLLREVLLLATGSFHRELVRPFHTRAETALSVLAGERSWPQLAKDERTALVKAKDGDIAQWLERSTGQQAFVAETLALDRVLRYLREGKVVLSGSFCYQDTGKLFETELSPETGERHITQDVLTQLYEGRYPVDLGPLIKVREDLEAFDSGDEDAVSGPPIVSFQEMKAEVAQVVGEHCPQWFNLHREAYWDATDRMFGMEYDEEEYRTNFYEAVGLMGRNFRVRDSPRFGSLMYFVQRYLNDEALDLELRLQHEVLQALTGQPVEGIIIDTMGIEGRRRGPFATYHGRYGTIGFADLRAISPWMVPVFSQAIPSMDSEAMHAVEVVHRATRILGGKVRIYTGNGHTTSRMSAGLVFLTDGVVAAGRFQCKPGQLKEKQLTRLMDSAELLNHIGAVLRRKPEYGHLLHTRKHISVRGRNVRPLIELLGDLILMNVEPHVAGLSDIIQRIETSNRQKRVVRIIERGVTRSPLYQASLYMKSAELILTMAAIWNVLHGNSRGFLGHAHVGRISMFEPC